MQPNMRQPLAQAVIPGVGVLREALLLLGGAVLIAIAAQISIPLPFSPVPVTGQTFAVLLMGAAFGSRRGVAAVGIYIAAGLLYLPVFASGVGGPARLFGPTGGYLLGFIAAAWLVGWLCERGLDRKLSTATLAMLLGTVIIYLFGLPWLAMFVGIDNVLMMGLVPFIPGAIIKLVAAAAVLPTAWKFVGR